MFRRGIVLIIAIALMVQLLLLASNWLTTSQEEPTAIQLFQGEIKNLFYSESSFKEVPTVLAQQEQENLRDNKPSPTTLMFQTSASSLLLKEEGNSNNNATVTNESLLLHSSYLKARLHCKNKTFFLPPPKLVQTAIQQLSSSSLHHEVKSGTEKAAICVLQKNEDWFLEEWINYHFALGFEDIYLFNDAIDDTGGDDDKQRTPETNLKSTGHLHIFPVVVADLSAHVHKQVAVYNACVEIIKSRQPLYNTTWVSFLDVDEF
jgi:hypothetical protein